VVITGTSGADTLNGTTSADTISGLGGNDTLNGKAGNDVIKGGTGSDKIGGDNGHDSLYGDDGDDQVYGGTGNDVLFGGNGNDSLFGEAGTDTLKGEAGNDILKSGTGLAYLYGGAGNDSLHYEPTASNIKDVGSYLSTSLLNGDAGTDTLNIVNKATYTDGTATKTAHTYIYHDNYNGGQITFTAQNAQYYDPTISVGSFKGIENVIVNGSGGLTFVSGSSVGDQPSITGTAGVDTFSGSAGNDKFKGGAGNDTFYFNGGNDTITSENNDADIFHFGWGTGTGTATVTGFNGVGSHTGDKIYMDDYYFPDPETQVVESGGKTTFTANSGEKLIVTTTGLIEGVDWFLT
jgi:Ca2+-binding RTX toxin-like protein